MNTLVQSSKRIILTAVCSFTVAAAAKEAPKMPDFVEKVQLHNLAGAEPTEDGTGVRLHRLPKSVRDQLTHPNKNSGKTGADTMMAPRHSEIRFVLNDGEKLENVQLTLQTESSATVTIYWGDVYSGERRIQKGGNAKPFGLTGHGLLFAFIDKYPRGRFHNRVCRVIIDGDDATLYGIEGDVRPPAAEELAPVMMSYGTSISEGYNASRSDLQWNSLTARMLGYDVVNLGSSGTAFCEKAMADYIAAQPWDLAVLEISVNMVGNFDTPEFKVRATYMIDTLAKSHPNTPIFCISIFPFGIGDYRKGDGARKTGEFREALKQIVESSGHKNVHYVHGPDLLSFSGLYHDMLHPSDMGMIEIANNLVQKIRAVLEKQP